MNINNQNEWLYSNKKEFGNEGEMLQIFLKNEIKMSNLSFCLSFFFKRHLGSVLFGDLQ